MNKFQKTASLIIFVIIATTLAIFFTIFDMPFSGILKTEFTAIVLSEIIIGAVMMSFCGRRERHLPFALSFWFPCTAYFVFTLVMIIPAYYDVTLKHFILTHVIGLAAACVWYLTIVLGKQSMISTDAKESIGMTSKDEMKSKISVIRTVFESAHPDEKALIRAGEALADDFRFSSVSIDGGNKYDGEILDLMDELETLASGDDVDAYKNKLGKLKNLLTQRERM